MPLIRDTLEGVLIARGMDFGGEEDGVEETDVGVEGPLLSMMMLEPRRVTSLSVVIDAGAAVVVVDRRPVAPIPVPSPSSFASALRPIACC